YGRVILAEPSMVMASLGGIYFFDLYISVIARSGTTKQSLRLPHSLSVVRNDKRYLWFTLSILFTSIAFLLKPTAVFFVLPIIYLAFKRFGWKTFTQWPLWLFTLLTLAPLIWWRMWMQQFPEGIPANTWLLNGNGIRFRPAFFRWMLYERLTILISGYLGMVFVLFGLFKIKKVKESLFFVSFLVSSSLYVTVFATGNVQHDYYQIPIMPSVAILFAIGGYFLSQWTVKKVPVGIILVVLCVLCSFFFSWQRVKDYFNINNPSIIVAGKAVDRLTPKDAKIVANYNGDTSFLYQANRKGWASFQDPMPVLIQKGADYLVLVNPTKADEGWKKEYKVVEQTPQYLIFDLHSKP
ncbi:hypothetical protein HY310_01005, partial [Candidatus Microgenomates bacterium]|nr:hypothetical protein [Candidatus Microgenomates bacterium]